jgi:anti-sigma regulatory factor (Ser/Thr protein kinase)
MQRRTLRIMADTANLEKIRDFVAESAQDAGLPESDMAGVLMSVDETATNIIRHAYREDPDIPEEDRWIEVETEAENGDFLLRLRDRGKPFNPVNVPAPDMEKHFEENRTHGLGIFAVKSFMDGIEHTYSDGNEVLIRKRIKK